MDGFFWDEPHYALPEGLINGGGHDWTCRCNECMRKFKDYYGYEMPRIANDDVRSFRWREALFTLSDVSRRIKEVNPDLEITCCVHATLDTYYVTELRGYDRWEMVAACPYFDVFSSTIIGWGQPKSVFTDITKRTVDIARKYGKQCERWIMGYYEQPEDFDEIDRVVDLYESMGVDRIAAWTYRGGYGTNLASRDALALWDRIGENYKRVLKRED